MTRAGMSLPNTLHPRFQALFQPGNEDEYFSGNVWICNDVSAGNSTCLVLTFLSKTPPPQGDFGICIELFEILT